MFQSVHRFFPSRLIFFVMLAIVAALMGLFFDKTKSVAQQNDLICRVLLIVDRSGSIGTQLDNYKTSIKSLFNKEDRNGDGKSDGIYDKNIYLGFWTFSHQDDPSNNRYNDPKYGSYTISTAKDDDIQRYNGFISTIDSIISPFGPTNYRQAFGYKSDSTDSFNPTQEIKNLADQADMVVLVTDGLPNYPIGDPVASAQKALSNLVSRNAKIDSIVGVLISGQTGDNPENLRRVIQDGSLSRSVPFREVVSGINFNEVGSALTDKVPKRCYEITGTRDTLSPKVVTNKQSISSDTEQAFSYSVNNPGTRISDKADWSIKRYIFDPSGRKIDEFEVVRSTLPHQFKSGNTIMSNNEFPGIESKTTLTVNPEWEKNTKICDVLTLRQNLNTTKDLVSSLIPPPLVVSPPENAFCTSFVGFQPIFQVRGGDFYVGRHFLTDQTKKTTSSIDGRGVMTLGGQKYSSWAEYGVFATGDVKNFASGAAFSGTGGGAHPLTFANVDNTYGKFISDSLQSSLWTIPNVVATLLSGTYSNTSLSASQLDLKDVGSNVSVKYVSDSTSLTINNTKSNNQLNDGANILINAPNTDITIDSDIKLSNSYSSIKSLPQLVIIAKNIYIQPNVKEVNAWLIAQGTESDGGKINTCKYVASSSECEAEPLRVNGPLIARTLQAHRKYTRYDPSATSQKLEAAEVFNLPATAYLYLLNKKTADNNNNPLFETSWSVELPPYF